MAKKSKESVIEISEEKRRSLTANALSAAGGRPPNYTKTKITKVGASGYRINVFAKLETNPTDSIVFSMFHYDQ